MRAIERRKASIGTRDGNDARASDVDVVRDDDDGRDGRDLEGSRADADADAEDGDASIASHSRAIVEGAGIVVVRGRVDQPVIRELLLQPDEVAPELRAAVRHRAHEVVDRRGSRVVDAPQL